MLQHSLLRLLACLLSVCLVTAGLVRPVAAGTGDGWTPATLEAFETLPVQEGGRVKPLDTLAGFQLLKLNGTRSVALADGSKLGRTEWLLECLFFPERAVDLPCFLVRNKDALIASDLDVPGKKRSDRYSYRELESGRRRIFEKAGAASAKEAATRSVLESQILQLATNLREFEDLLHFLDFARTRFPVAGEELLEIFGGASEASLSEVLEVAPRITSLVRELAQNPSASGADEGVRRLMLELEAYMQSGGHGLALFPPDSDPAEQAAWLNPAELVLHAFDPSGELPVEKKVEMVGVLEQLYAAREDPVAFGTLADSLSQGLVGLAEERGEYQHVPLEVAFYKVNYFFWGKVLFVLSFLLLAFTWLKPARWLDVGVWSSLLAGTGMTVIGITMRCIIRERPPISTLYETILFVTASGVITLLVVERLTRQRVALLLAPILGASGLFMAMKYELKEAITSGDTMPSLVAVLDTNFWLATHVTTVTLGYAAGLFVASPLAHAWLFGRIFGIKRGDKQLYKSITRMIYGTLLFGLLFSVVGTILGGIWANYSWGRFWGWDPKENGALLICLWELLILHARLGGYIRDFGLAVMAIIGGVVVAFSWWGVNLLGVGLHSYGFTDGVQFWLTLFYLVELGVIVVGGIWWLVQRSSSGSSGRDERALAEEAAQ